MGYITVDQVRAEGVDDPVGYPTERIQAAIDVWSRFVEDATGQWFEPRQKTLVMDGNDSYRIFLPVPVLSIMKLFANGDFSNPISSTLYRVYKERNEDRRNPKVELFQGDRRDGIFTPGFRAPGYGNAGRIFIGGQQNQKLVGYFGYVDEAPAPVTVTAATNASPIQITAPAHGLGADDWVEVKDVAGNEAANGIWKIRSVDADHFTLTGSAGSGTYVAGGQFVRLFTPVMVQHAVMVMVLNNIGPKWDGEKATRQEYTRAYEMTDRSAVQYDTPAKMKLKGGTYAITKDMAIERIIQMYRRPIALAVPGCSWLEQG
jgi:hypothetical protein